MGKKSCTKGGVRSCVPPPKLFLPGGGGQGNAAHTHPPRPCAQAFRWSSLPAGTQSASLLLHFGHRLATMAGMAKALEIAAVREHCPVSAVRLDVVHFRGRRPVSAPGTFPAKGLAKELSRPQVLRPLWSQVHPVPGLGRIAAAVLGAVEITIAASDQGRTPRMSAWTQRLLCHGLSPRAKQKACANTSALCGSCGTGSLAQALVDIHDGLFSAELAIHRQAPGSGL